MPKRTDIQKILIIGAGPIVIGQACEFDYSGTQACKALKEEGYTVILLNSNPATIMTDPDFADRTYIEPVTPEVLARIIEKERPDAVLPTLGGQTALNTAVAVAKNGTLEKFGVELIGAKLPAIEKAEDRTLFKQAMEKIGLGIPRSGLAHNFQEAMAIIEHVGFPAIIRPSFTLGGTGGGIAYNREEYEEMALAGIDASPTNEILVEESVIGWKEFELEVMRDSADNVVIICSIENFDADGGAYRRFDHRGAGADADRQGVPDPARRLDPDHPRDRRRYRRLQYPVRDQSARRPPGGDRNESPRFPLFRPCLQGDRLPDRQDRRQAVGRLYPG